MGAVIRNAVNRRINGQRHQINANWRALLDDYLQKSALVQKSVIVDTAEDNARQEKAAALKELAESRFSVLIGPAGTGKTTLLSVLCEHPDIAAGEVLLLAPTGKARVRIEQAAKGLKLETYTLAQFLHRCGRYDGRTQRYRLSAQPAQDSARTVIVDEASMLTEEMLAALLNALKGPFSWRRRPRPDLHRFSSRQTSLFVRVLLIDQNRQIHPFGCGDFLLALPLNDNFSVNERICDTAS